MQKEIENILREVITSQSEVLVTPSRSFEHGDYSSGVALKEENSMVVAQKIANTISDDRFEKVEAVAPGFVNFFLSKNYLKSELLKIIEQGDLYGSDNSGQGKRMVIDYSSPNIAKLFGVGHLRSTIIGQAIYNIYQFLGWDCIGDNHLGDWGTQFGKLLYQITKEGLEDRVEELSVQELEELYISFHREAANNPEMEDAGRQWFKRLEEGDELARKIWQACVDTSKREFDRIYQLLGVKIDVALGESFYNDINRLVIEEVKSKGIAKESQGALIVEFDNLPSLILVKSDGTTTYFVRDLATLKYRREEWNPDLIVYEIGSDQSLYLKQVFATARLLGWNNELVHVAHGLVRWPHGKFSTRKGETIHLEEVLNQTIERAYKIIESSDFSQSEKETISQSVGIGAVKYNDLSQHHSRDILFDWDKMLNLKGNSAPYLQYTFARTESVLDKIDGYSSDFSFNQLTPEDEVVLRKIRFFPSVVQDAARSFSPNLICNFLFELAQDYNSLYSKHKIIGVDFRITLTKGVNQVLKNGLTLLGIDTPSKM